MLLTLLSLITGISVGFSFQCPEGNCQKLKLNDILKEGYDKGTPPGKPALVEIYIAVLNIRSVRETTMSFQVDVFLHQRWTDNRLTFPENVTDNKILLDINWKNEIWKPDILFKNLLEGKVHNTIVPYTYFNMFRNNTIFFASRLSLELSCEMHLQNFPHDVQHCEIIVMGLTHTANELKFRWQNSCGLFITKRVLLPQFEVVDQNCSECTNSYDIGSFSCLKATITMKRQTGYYNINVYIPSILIVFMSMLTFWIPPEAVPARVTLGVTSLLTIVTKQYQSSLPSVSYIVAMNIWMSCCIAFVFFSLLEFALVLWIKQNSKSRPQTPALPSLQVEDITSSDTRFFKYSRMKKYFINWKQIDIDRIARVLFPLAFLCQIIVYFAKYGF